MFTENEATSATTRNYAPEQTPQAYLEQPYISPYAGGGNPEVVNTSRLYNPPAGVGPAVPPRNKSRAWLWVLASFLFLLFIAGVGAAVFFSRPGRTQQPLGDQIAEEVMQRVETELGKAGEELLKNEKEREAALKKAQEVLKELPPLAPSVSREMPAGLEKYRYPNSELGEVVSVFGNEMIKMSTDDDFDQVRDFYQKTAGQPTVAKDGNQQKLIFQIPGSPAILISVSPDNDDPNLTQIFIWRSKFKIPKIN